MKRKNKIFPSSGSIGAMIFLALILFLAAGWIKCIVKAVNCNWDPVGKAEVVYTIGVFTGAGVVIGWIDIEDK